ncbi:MAG: N-6 DNA methylase [Bacteroidia bacterium]|nr:N-6 DNA methylase [Bacteroidia bacterium]
MEDLGTKINIISAINSFSKGSLTENGLKLFQSLGYITERKAHLSKPTFKEFKDSYIEASSKFNETKALVHDWKYVDLLFQLSKEEVLKQTSLFDTKKVDDTVIESYLFFVVELNKDQYSRTDLSLITREVNRLFPMPVMILFKHGNALTLSVINRRLHKRDESKDVLEKVTQIKDINITTPHRAHIEILQDLSFDELKEKYAFTNFVELHNGWQKTLDTKELNRKFFNELANWYFWATTKVTFPDDEIEDKEIRNATGVIRLITRLMFVWFLKEKRLVPEELFDDVKLKSLLKYQDGNKSTYYKAILQNLFFATLNTEMGKRKFRSSADKSLSSHYFIHNLFRYENEFFKPKETLERYFDPIPFLNGGLFECLDKQIEKNGKLKSIRIDGFSDRIDNVLKVPDELFFSEKEKVIDLSKVYGTPKKSKEKVRGLINILGSYKFTIAENTPIEEEVALDPELLGKVFENLLANYNPETQTTARKQTGSFYTPREIVNYMVDESLLAYLKQNLNDKSETENNLRELLSYSEKEIQFSKTEIEILINAIDNIKIIDPACGSGAFPMGILHKLVHILHKLDPKNEKWEQLQLAKVDRLIEEAETIQDTRTRENVISDLEKNKEQIEEDFNNNELDFGRKLFLIENCIYGVDIQPIAVQISKLRFFISLIVEQKTNPKKENLGVRPLPNLETKFVAANTLVDLEKENANLFTNPEIDKKKEQLKKVRHDYFEARTPKRKTNCREKDKQLRDELTELLVTNHDLQPDTAKKIVAWNPYDQNTFAPFFDTEWMFGLKDGFDVVIGNPPYKIVDSEDKLSEFFKFKYESSKGGKTNLYKLFIEKGIDLLKHNGAIAFINPNTYLTGAENLSLRNLMLKSTQIKEIIEYTEAEKVFENVTQAVTTLILKKGTGLGNIIKIKTEKQGFCTLLQDDIIKSEDKVFLPENNVIKLIKNSSKYTFADFTESYKGEINLGVKKKFISITKTPKSKLMVRGRQIGAFSIVEYPFEYCELEADNRAHHKLERIIFPEISNQYLERRIKSYLCLGEFICSDTTNYMFSVKNNISNKFLLALLNSKVIDYFFKYYNTTNHIPIGEVRKIPFVFLDETLQEPFIKISNYILSLKRFNKDSSFFERLIDAMVYELYLPNAIRKGKCEVLKHLGNLPELKEGEGEKNLKMIERVYKELSYSKHPVNQAIDKMDGVEEIRIIEGKK